MSDIKVTERDPFEFYRDNEAPANINDPSTIRQIASSHLADKNPHLLQPIDTTARISAEKLAEMAENSHGSIKDRNQHEAEVLREVLEQRGIRTSSPRNRTYHFT